MTTGLEKRRQKKPVADTTGRGTWTGEPPSRIRAAEKGAGSRRRDGYAGLPEGVSGLPPCAGRKILPDAFPRDPGQGDGAFSHNRHS